MRNKLHIGRYETIDFIEYNVKDLPSKVDTGADTSSVWASNININDQKLEFCLFDKNSAFYTGKKITFKKGEYSEVVITNSFGVKEKRYKVKILIKIKEKKIRTSFTLADRSRNKFPCLIGSSLLKGKFIVDVSNSNKQTVKQS
jgi:hypothetical protein